MAKELVRVLRSGELAPGRMTFVDLDGLPVALANVEGTIYAFSDSCRHEGGPLSTGVLIADSVTCPWHGWTYSVRSGKSLIPPVGLRLPTYPVVTIGDEVYIELDWDVSN